MTEPTQTQLDEWQALVDAAVPEGWKLVPIEPTVEMLRVGAYQFLNFYSEKGPYPRSRAVYRAMINAAPPAPETKK